MKAKKFLIIKECIREIKGVDVYEFVKAYKICFTLDVVFL